MDELQSNLLLRELITPANPGANTEFVVTVAATERFTPGAWLVKAVSAQLAAGSTSVQPVLIIDDGAGHLVGESVGANAAQSSGTTCAYTWASGFVQSGIQGAGTDEHSQSPLMCGDECLCLPGWRIRSHTVGLNATSAWTNVVIYVCGIG